MSDPHDQGNPSRDVQVGSAEPAPEDLRELWLDLEDTVITPVLNGWFNTECINGEKVRRFIEEYRPSIVHIFSFAIWDEHQRERFNLGTRPMLEQHLGVKFNLVLAVDTDIIPICCKQMNLAPSTVDFQEMSNFWSKQGAFRHCARHHVTNLLRHYPNRKTVMTLLDDAVYNETVHWPDLNATCQQINIDQLYT